MARRVTKTARLEAELKEMVQQLAEAGNLDIDQMLSTLVREALTQRGYVEPFTAGKRREKK